EQSRGPRSLLGCENEGRPPAAELVVTCLCRGASMWHKLAGKWKCVDGGPRVLLPAELLRTWEGSDQPSGGRVVATDFRVDGNHSRPATDYDLACSHAEVALSLILVENKHCLVLG